MNNAPLSSKQVAILALISVLILLPALSRAQSAGLAVRGNSWPGLGAGSMQQGDSLGAMRFKAADIVGISLIGVGAIGIVGTTIEREMLLAMVGETTKADYYICGGIAVAGLATLVTSRILAGRKAKKYNVTPFACGRGGGGMTLLINF